MKIMRIVLVLGALFGTVASLGEPVVASHETPRTFGACVLAGGNVSLRGGWPSCVMIETGYDRIYGSVTCEDGDQVPFEIWVERRTATVTFLLRPGRTIDREDGGIDDPNAVLATPAPDVCEAT